MVTIDIKNAFNTADWDLILKKMKDKGISEYLVQIVSEYLSDRVIVYAKGRESVNVKAGSVLGSTLWNLLYDDVLKTEMATGVKTVGFADDTALIVSADHKTTLITKTDEGLDRIGKEICALRLRIAEHKCEALILKGRRDKEGIDFQINGARIEVKKEIKYLGIIWSQNRRNTFGLHIMQTKRKAEETSTKLGPLMPNVDGPSSTKRSVVCGTIHFILLHAAPIWQSVTEIGRYKEMLEATQGKGLLRVASAYCTKSTTALQVITATVPMHLLITKIVCVRTWHRYSETTTN
mgnify:FL=1